MRNRTTWTESAESPSVLHGIDSPYGTAKELVWVRNRCEIDTLARWLIGRDAFNGDLGLLQDFHEKPWHWNDEYQQMKAEIGGAL